MIDISDYQQSSLVIEDIGMRKKGKKMLLSAILDTIKAMRRGSRNTEMELLYPGFHSHCKIHKSDKVYTRKKKHKGGW